MVQRQIPVPHHLRPLVSDDILASMADDRADGGTRLPKMAELAFMRWLDSNNRLCEPVVPAWPAPTKLIIK